MLEMNNNSKQSKVELLHVPMSSRSFQGKAER